METAIFLTDAEWSALYKRFCVMAAQIASKPKEKRQKMEQTLREVLKNEGSDVQDILTFVFAAANKYAKE